MARNVYTCMKPENVPTRSNHVQLTVSCLIGHHGVHALKNAAMGKVCDIVKSSKNPRVVGSYVTSLWSQKHALRSHVPLTVRFQHGRLGRHVQHRVETETSSALVEL